MMLVNHTPVRYGLHYYYPLWADVIGWVMVMATLLIIPLYAAYKVYKQPGGSVIQVGNIGMLWLVLQPK